MEHVLFGPLWLVVAAVGLGLGTLGLGIILTLVWRARKAKRHSRAGRM